MSREQAPGAQGPRAGASADSAGAGVALARLREVLREQGGMVAELLSEDGDTQARSDPARLVAGSPRASADPIEYELLVEAIYEGYLLHYGAPRLLCASLEQDLALLVGDQLYALGLARLVQLGDIAAVAELADVITLCALAHGGQAPEMAQAVWLAGARAIGWGGDAAHSHAKALARQGSPEALAAMRAAAVS